MTVPKRCRTARHSVRSQLFSAYTAAVLACFALTAAPAPAQELADGESSSASQPVVLLSDTAQLFPVDDLSARLPTETTAVPYRSVSGFAFLPQDTQPPPEPSHTGFKALAVETWGDFKAFPRRRSTWVILGIGAGAAAAVHPVDDNVNAHLQGSDAAASFFAPGKWIGSAYVQVGASVGIYLVGRYALPHADGERTNKVSHIGFDMLRALAVSQTFTQVIKNTVRRDRPTGVCCAFPSGHASAAFATASVIERHFGYRGSVPMFLVATYVAMSRLHEDQHFLSDVVFGASLGMASGWTVVGRHGRSSYAVAPVPVRGGVMVTLMRNSPGQAPRSSHVHCDTCSGAQ